MCSIPREFLGHSDAALSRAFPRNCHSSGFSHVEKSSVPQPLSVALGRFSQRVSPQVPSLLLHLHLQFGLPLLSGCFSWVEMGERHFGRRSECKGLPKTPLTPGVGGDSGVHQQGLGFPSPTSRARLFLLRDEFVAPVSWVMPAIATYFVVRPHTFLCLFAPTVRKTWGLAQTLCLPFAAAMPRWISPPVD